MADILGKIRIGMIDYAIQEMNRTEINDEFGAEEGQGVLGFCDMENQRIVVCSELAPQRKKQTLMHEIVHGMLYEMGYVDHDEELVDRFGIILHGMLEQGSMELYMDSMKEDEADEN